LPVAQARFQGFKGFRVSKTLIAQAFVASLKPCGLETAGVGSGGAVEEGVFGELGVG
jgi:hypothetical protein